MAKLSNKEKRKRAFAAAKFLTENQILLQKFREVFQLYDCSDKKMKKKVLKMFDMYAQHLYEKSSDYQLEQMLSSKKGSKDEPEYEEDNGNDSIKDFFKQLN